MKKLICIALFSLSLGLASHAQDDKDKVKKTSTVPQKVHNTVSRHKKYKGYKTKHKHGDMERKKKVDLRNGEVKQKSSR
jgi:hypothetical protein